MPLQTSLGVLSDADLWNLKQALAAAAAPQTTPPVSTQPVPPVTTATPQFVTPAECAGRARLMTEAKWARDAGTFYSPSALNDGNVWLIGFTVADTSAGRIATVEFRGFAGLRNWVLIRNRDGAVTVRGTSTQTPTIAFGPPMRLVQRLSLPVGERYTWAIWNAPGTSPGGMAGQFYFA